MPQVGFEPTIPEFQRAKTVHALDVAATVIGIGLYIYMLEDIFVKTIAFRINVCFRFKRTD
jgi:hypothetical protein